MNDFLKSIKTAADYIVNITNSKSKIAIILGSGLGSFADNLEDKLTIEYNKIPNFPIPKVIGHKGCMIFGKIDGKEIIVMQGRVHLYEGYNAKQVTFPIHVLARLSIKNLIITNAVGAINLNFSPSNLMLIKDQINWTFRNPLTGFKNQSLQFNESISLFNPYYAPYINMAKKVAHKNDLQIYEGILISNPGPSYETAAEIKMMRILGADVISMSTVLEVIVAGYYKMRILGISCITNYAAGVSKKKLDHQEVIDTGKKVSSNLYKLLTGCINEIHHLGHNS